MFQWWGRRYLNCQAVHSSVSCAYDTSCFFVSYNAHRFRCEVLTQEVKCLLTQIYMVESALLKECAGWAIIKTNEPATAAACKSEHCFPPHYSNVFSHSLSPSQWFLICLYSSFTKPAFPLTFPMKQCVYPYGNEDFFTSLFIKLGRKAELEPEDELPVALILCHRISTQ